jgi:hypothetical protein
MRRQCAVVVVVVDIIVHKIKLEFLLKIKQ